MTLHAATGAWEVLRMGPLRVRRVDGARSCWRSALFLRAAWIPCSWGAARGDLLACCSGGVASRGALMVLEGGDTVRVRERMREGADNYDAEMGARMEVLHRASEAGARRILVLLDAISPDDASRT